MATDPVVQRYLDGIEVIEGLRASSDSLSEIDKIIKRQGLPTDLTTEQQESQDLGLGEFDELERAQDRYRRAIVKTRLAVANRESRVAGEKMFEDAPAAPRKGEDGPKAPGQEDLPAPPKGTKWSATQEQNLRSLEIQTKARERARRTAQKELDEESQLEGKDDNSSHFVDLEQFLNGTFVQESATVGGSTTNGLQMLYPGKWHTCIAMNTAGKSWFGLWHALMEMRNKNTVLYLHFEESTPVGTIGRLLSLGATKEEIRLYFRWMDCTKRWTPAKFSAHLDNREMLPTSPVLVILDGINAACSQYEWNVNETKGVGCYRVTFVTPAAKRGSAVLSLGHPTKDVQRQNERHSYGSSAWLDEVDGVGFRMEADRKTPIRKGYEGMSHVFTVKDRPGGVESECVRDGKAGREQWYHVGAFRVDSTHQDTGPATRVELVTYEEDLFGDGEQKTPVDVLYIQIRDLLQKTGGYTSNTTLSKELPKHNKTDLQPALSRLEQDGLITRGPEIPGRARPGTYTGPPASEPSVEEFTP